MAEFDPARTKARILLTLARLARREARAFARSQTLRETMFVELRTPDVAVVGVPHYWAVYYHDGRGPVRARNARFLVYFKDPAQDPRILGGYPVREGEVKRLTAAQFRRAVELDQVIVTRAVGPAEGNPFFTEGLKNFPVQADRVGLDIFRRDFLASVRELKGGTIDVRF